MKLSPVPKSQSRSLKKQMRAGGSASEKTKSLEKKQFVPLHMLTHLAYSVENTGLQTQTQTQNYFHELQNRLNDKQLTLKHKRKFSKQKQKEKESKKKQIFTSKIKNFFNSKLQKRLQSYYLFLILMRSTLSAPIGKSYTQNRRYTIFIGKGNNSKLVKKLFYSRHWWNITNDQKAQNINLIWTQWSKRSIFSLLQLDSDGDKQKQKQKDKEKQKEKEKKKFRKAQNRYSYNPSNTNTNFNLNQNHNISPNPSKNNQNKNYESLASKSVLYKISNQQQKQAKKSTLLHQANFMNKTKQKQKSKEQQKDIQKEKDCTKIIKGSGGNQGNQKDQEQHSAHHLSQNDNKHQINHQSNNLNNINVDININRQTTSTNSQSTKINQHGSSNSNSKNPEKILIRPHPHSAKQNRQHQTHLQPNHLTHNKKRHITFTCNHVEGHQNITDKKNLLFCLQQYCNQTKENCFDIVPLSFNVSGTEAQFAKLQQIQKQLQLKASKQERKPIWIIKPGQKSNRGNGIKVFKKIQQIKQYMDRNKEQQLEKYPTRTYIIQKYIYPALYHRRKFDIRCFVLLIASPHISAYFYNDGYLRTCSKEFKDKKIDDKFMHLTNDAIQKKGNDYGKFQKGNKITFEEYQNFLDMFEKVQINFKKDIIPKIKSMAAKSIAAGCKKFNQSKKSYSFEILGYDFMIDQQYKPWLIEVNTNPCLETGCPVLDNFITSAVNGAIKIAIDTVFKPPKVSDWHLQEVITFPEKILQPNKYELIFQEQYYRE